jgi:hypothetical protein
MKDSPNLEMLRTRSAGMAIWARPYLAQVRGDAAFHWFVAAYAAVGLLISIAAGVPHKFEPLAYLDVFAWMALPALIVGTGLWSLGSPTPLKSWWALLRQISQPETLSGLLLFASLTLFVGVFVSVKTMLPDMVPFFADRMLADLDRALHGQAPWRYTTALMPAQLMPALERIYFGVWNLLLPGSVLAVLLAPRLRAVRARYLWALLLTWVLLGNVLAGALLSAGPVYYHHVTGEARFAGLMEYLGRYSGAREWRDFLWQGVASGDGTGVSAFPSMHLANATLFMLLAARINRPLTWAAAAFVAVILFGSVHLGWHYAVDGYFSIAVTLLIWKLVGLRLSGRRQKAAPPRKG